MQKFKAGVGALLTAVAMASGVQAGVIGSDGTYLDWSRSDSLDGWTLSASGTGHGVTKETVDGRASMRLHDSSITGIATATRDITTNPAAADFRYVIAFDVRFDSGAAESGNAILIRERPATNDQLAYLYTNGGNLNLRWRFGATNLKDQSTGVDYAIPTDTWTRFSLERLSETEYRVRVDDGAEHDLGVHTIPAGIGAPTRYQLGTGVAAAHTHDYAFSTFSVGEAVPEPTAAAAMVAGAVLIGTRRR